MEPLETVDRLLKLWSRYRGRIIGAIAGVIFGLLLLRYGMRLFIPAFFGALGYLVGLVWEAQR